MHCVETRERDSLRSEDRGSHLVEKIVQCGLLWAAGFVGSDHIATVLEAHNAVYIKLTKRRPVVLFALMSS